VAETGHELSGGGIGGGSEVPGQDAEVMEVAFGRAGAVGGLS